MFRLSTPQKRLLLFVAWCAITVCVQLFGHSVMEYMKYIVGPYTLRHLSGGIGVFAVLFLLGVTMHFLTHWLTSHKR